VVRPWIYCIFDFTEFCKLTQPVFLPFDLDNILDLVLFPRMLSCLILECLVIFQCLEIQIRDIFDSLLFDWFFFVV